MFFEIIRSHIYVVPSNIENGCNALCDAMLLEMPCISNLARGTGTTTKDWETGFLLQNNDPITLAGAIF